MDACLNLLELRRAFRPVGRAPLLLVERVDPLVLPFGVKGVRAFRIDGGEADDLIRVDIVADERHGRRLQGGEGLHHSGSTVRGSAMWPASADAATISGEARCVRVSGPWRLSKLRLVELTTRCLGPKLYPPE